MYAIRMRFNYVNASCMCTLHSTNHRDSIERYNQTKRSGYISNLYGLTLNRK